MAQVQVPERKPSAVPLADDGALRDVGGDPLHDGVREEQVGAKREPAKTTKGEGDVMAFLGHLRVVLIL